MIEGYSPWHTDENKRYCLMDTMDIVAVYRKVPDIVEGVRAVLEGITLVIIPNVVAESAGVCKELSGKEWDDLKTLESDIEEGVRELGVPVEFAFPPDGVLSEATARYSNADSDGAGLSLVDTILLCIAARMANVDVMTEGKALRSAIEAECGTGRTCTAREKYQKRNGCTAWFISVVTGNDEPWWQMRDGKIEYLSGDSSVAVLEIAGNCWGMVRECSIGKPGAVAAIGAFYQTALLDGYCPCGSSDGNRSSAVHRQLLRGRAGRRPGQGGGVEVSAVSTRGRTRQPALFNFGDPAHAGGIEFGQIHDFEQCHYA